VPLTVYDEIRQKKVPFEPLVAGKVGMYVCGMTVQDRPHMGHMLAFVSSDVIRRYLEHLGYEVTFIQNFTDIDDKIIAKATEEGLDCRVVAQRNIDAYFSAAEALNVRPATVYPCATEHIDDIVALIARLEAGGHAYPAGGDVYFRVRSMADYGKLSRRNVDDLMSGARIEVGEEKEDPLDFALWKGSQPPHGGGEDLIFPHHENEIAQSECATGRPFVRFWLHNGLLNLRGQKMSKSTGHFFSMEDVLREFSGEVVRFYLLSTHFRSQSEFSRERLTDASRAYERLVNACRSIEEQLTRLGDGPAVSTPAGARIVEAAAATRTRFQAAMDDDFNTAGAVGQLFELVRAYNSAADEPGAPLARDREALEAVRSAIASFDAILGLFRDGLPRAVEDVPAEIQRLVAEREAARKARDFARADALRGEIAEAGFVLEDTPQGARVRHK
jgi:cysteinyl-tRNA synthetase